MNEEFVRDVGEFESEIGHPIGRVIDIERNVLLKTIDQQRSNLEKWSLPFSAIDALYDAIYKFHLKDTFENSMVLSTILRYQTASLRITAIALRGFYENALRELRYILEETMQSYYLDMMMGNSDLSAKSMVVAIIENMRLRGSKLVDECGFPAKTRKILTELYQKLSGYIHPSFEQLEMAPELPYVVSYDREKYELVEELYLMVFDAILTINLLCFPQCKEAVLSKSLNKWNEKNLGQVLKKLNLETTLSTFAK